MTAKTKNIEIVYFAWVRERIGRSSETIMTCAATIEDLIHELAAKDESYLHAFSDRALLRFALDEELVEANAPLEGAELAIFPPMTGG